MTTTYFHPVIPDADAYVAEYLADCTYSLRDFVASALNPATPMSLHIEICPHCTFLHVAGTECDVCATSRAASGHPMLCLRSAGDTVEFQIALDQARCRRARALYEQWMSGHVGADALFWMALAERGDRDSAHTDRDLHFAPAPADTRPVLLAA